jgi:hypothetical protein
MLVDAVTGAPVGVQSPNANGPDGIWTPIDVTSAQIASPTPEMVADLNATYRLSVAPYYRYQSNGSMLVQVGGQEDVQLNTGMSATQIVYAPFTVDSINFPEGIAIQGTVSVRSLPA